MSGTSSSACTSDGDCKNNGVCRDGKCECNSGYVGDRCQFANACLSSPCQNDGTCTPVHEDGSYYCDCKLGFVDPTCNSRDPCVLQGNNRCLNGSTCRRKDDMEFVCECQYPYVGSFCETYDLCLVDVDECVGDLRTEFPDDPKCSPCIAGATCRQISVRQYECNCDAGVNHPSCHSNTYHQQNYRVPIADEAVKLEYYWNPIIPTIALTTFALYIILVLLVFIYLRKQKRRRPRLIVCCDIDGFDEQAFYLITVETGRHCRAGTTSDVYCFLCGENGQAGPFPLSDANLRQVHVLERDQEDNYLVSCPTDLGQIDKVIMFHYENNKKMSWLCKRATIRNIKTDENWFFYASSWRDANLSENLHQYKAATVEQVRKREMIGINGRHFAYQLEKYHAYVSPFIYPTPVRISLVFAEFMTYMLLLIALYGFLSIPDIDLAKSFPFTLPYIWNILVLKAGSIAGAGGFFLGILYALFFIFENTERIPTLIVWRNKPAPGVMEEKNFPIPTKEFRDAATNTDKILCPPVPPKPKKRKNVPVRRTPSPENKDSLFRIPSTDIVQTEAWVSDNLDDLSNSKNLSEGLVHDYVPPNDKPNKLTDAIIDYGLVGSLTDNRQQDPLSFVYQTESIRTLKSAMENDIRAAYQDLERLPKSSEESSREIVDKYEEIIEVEKGNSLEDSRISSESSIQFVEVVPVNERLVVDSEMPSHSSSLAAGDFKRDLKDEENIDPSSKIATSTKTCCEWCEMGNYRFGKILTRITVITGWIICVGMMITVTIICCVFGGRYGYQRTYDWCISLIISWGLNFLLCQIIKVSVLVVIITILIQKKKIPSDEAKRIHERLQLYYVQGLTVLPETHPTKFVQYLPQNWKKISDQVQVTNPQVNGKQRNITYEAK